MTLSYDDGVEQDAKLIEIMNKHGIKGTFNLNGGLFTNENVTFPPGETHRRLTEKAAKSLYTCSGHEVAVHAYSHPFLEQLLLPQAIDEVLEDRKKLEGMFHTVIRGMTYPYGTYSEELISALKNIGIAYSRTVEFTEDFRIPTNWLRLAATCHHNNGISSRICTITFFFARRSSCLKAL